MPSALLFLTVHDFIFQNACATSATEAEETVQECMVSLQSISIGAWLAISSPTLYSIAAWQLNVDILTVNILPACRATRILHDSCRPSVIYSHLLQEWVLDGNSQGQTSEHGFLRPVFRASPFGAEARRVEAGPASPMIVFLDEGNLCRSVAVASRGNSE